MKRIVFLLVCLAALAGGLYGQDLVIFVHTPGASSDGTPLAVGSSFSFPDTAIGSTSSQVMRVRNTSTTTSYEVVAIYFSQASPFTVTGTALDKCVAPGGNEDFTTIFTPIAIGSGSDTLLVSSTAFSSATGCTPTGGTSSLLNWATFNGQGLMAVIGGGGSGGGSSGELSLTFMATNGLINTLLSGSTFDFGRVQEGQTVSQVMTLTNSTSLPVTVPAIAVSGTGFSIVGSIASPLIIPAGSSSSFTVQFAPTSPTPLTGELTIGVQSITLTGTGFEPPFPAVSLSFNVSTLENQQQDQVTVNLANPAPYASVGTLAIEFTPGSSTSAIDNAIVFAVTGGKNLTVTFAEGSSVGTYNGVSAFTFQTGTTAGSLTFTFTMEGMNPVTQTFTLTPSVVQITSGNGKWLSPSLVVNLTGYDNSYSATKMLFTFYGADGQVLNPGGMTVDATSSFQQYFAAEQGYGGAFALQASFPVMGYSAGPSCLGVPSPPANCLPAMAVDVTIQNTVGTSATQHITFQ